MLLAENDVADLKNENSEILLLIGSLVLLEVILPIDFGVIVNCTPVCPGYMRKKGSHLPTTHTLAQQLCFLMVFTNRFTMPLVSGQYKVMEKFFGDYYFKWIVKKNCILNINTYLKLIINYTLKREMFHVT